MCIRHYDKRDSGIPLIGELRWGASFCQFYRTADDLFEILLPYFRAGFESNEFCVWISPEEDNGIRSPVEVATEFRAYAATGRLEVISSGRWLTMESEPLGAIVRLLDRAVSSGFEGLRIAFGTFTEMEDERFPTADEVLGIGKYNALAFYAYPRDRFDALGLMEVMKRHRYSLVRNAAGWEVIEGSEARIARNELKRSEERLQSLFSNMSEGFAYHRIVLDEDGKPRDFVFLEVNGAFERLTGRAAENIIGGRVTEVFPGFANDPEDWIGKLGRVALTGIPERFEGYWHALDKWCSVSAFSSQRGFFAVTISDITDRKRTEEALRRSEEMYRSLFDNMLNGFAYCRMQFEEDRPADFTYLAVNTAFEKLTGLRDVIGKKVTEVIPGIRESDPKLFDLYGKVAVSGNPDQFETYVEALGMWFCISVYSPRKGEFVAVFDMISERKRAEEALKASLQEKEVLLKEIHHRVKNNMQVISSLVSLQVAGSGDPSVKEGLKDVTSRVHSMALVHEKLYQSADLGRVDFGEYARSLLSYLWRSHGIVASSILLNLDLQSVQLPVDAAVPCGLILNELAGNTLKHAFKGRDDGEVTVSLRAFDESRILLVVRDNGVGLPEGLDWRHTTSLGLQLVQMLARQIGATVEVSNCEGTAFELAFDLLPLMPASGRGA